MKGRYPEHHGKNPVDNAYDSSCHEPNPDRRNKGDARFLREIHHERRQRVNLAHGQIDLAGDEYHHQAGRDDRGHGCVFREVSNVAERQECRRCALEVDNQHDAGNRDARFAGAQEEKARPAHQASGRSTPDGILSLRKKIRFVCCHGLPRSSILRSGLTA